MEWDEKTPIYLQIKDKVKHSILDGSMPEGDAVPSIRQVSMQYHINPLTVSKSYQLLVDDGVLEKRRGLGMFVKEGAQQRLLEKEKSHFLEMEWPDILLRIQRLGLVAEELLYVNGD